MLRLRSRQVLRLASTACCVTDTHRLQQNCVLRPRQECMRSPNDIFFTCDCANPAVRSSMWYSSWRGICTPVMAQPGVDCAPARAPPEPPPCPRRQTRWRRARPHPAPPTASLARRLPPSLQPPAHYVGIFDRCAATPWTPARGSAELIIESSNADGAGSKVNCSSGQVSSTAHLSNAAPVQAP